MSVYHRPRSLPDALAALAEPGARALVGGTDLLVGLRHGTVVPSVIVDLKALDDLPDPLRVTDDGIAVGPTLTLGELVADPAVQEWFPALVEAARTVGSVAIRNRASLVGNLCNASPAADTAPALLVHDVSVTITSPGGSRTVALAEFFHGPRRTACGPGELVTGLTIGRPAPGSGSAFQRLTRRRGVDLATVGVAAAVDRSGSVTLGLSAVAPTPLRVPVTGTVDAALGAATPISDVRGGQVYRTAMLRVLARRAIDTATDRRHLQEVTP